MSGYHKYSVCLFVCMYVCMHVCMYARTLACMYVFVCVYVGECNERTYVYSMFFIETHICIHIHDTVCNCFVFQQMAISKY